MSNEEEQGTHKMANLCTERVQKSIVLCLQFHMYSRLGRPQFLGIAVEKRNRRGNGSIRIAPLPLVMLKERSIIFQITTVLPLASCY